MVRSWGVVVPVKRLALAKTRLTPYDEATRQDLALAFAADVVAAARQVAQVLVVTDDERAAAALQELGVQVAPDDPDAGLNPALEHGAELLREQVAGAGVAALSADLPAVRAGHLREALAQVTHRGFVRDAAGTGTTLLAAADEALRPRFGPGSGAAHEASGARPLVAAQALRRDVDTAEDLLVALALGAGDATRGLAQRLGLRVEVVTVREWTEAGGAAYRDDGRSLELTPDCLSDSGFRFLRMGQRVRLAVDPAGLMRVALP